jgi:hypothetical protein
MAETATRKAVQATGGRVYASQQIDRSDGRLERVFYDIDSGELLGQEIRDRDGRTVSSVQLRSVDCLHADAPACDVSDPWGFTRWIDSHLSGELDTILTC